MVTVDQARQAAAIVRDAGGRIIGRTRLQKIGFILEAAGLGGGFAFKYKHFGPYSEDLMAASRTAVVLDMIEETEQPATWGGLYSTFFSRLPEDRAVSAARREIAEETAQADAVDLELAATALFLAKHGILDAWAETARRKPDKAEGRIDRARQLYERLRQIQTPQPLPQLNR
jgi:hypothetical protein